MRRNAVGNSVLISQRTLRAQNAENARERLPEVALIGEEKRFCTRFLGDSFERFQGIIDLA
jgi:hypothetical protein